VVSRKGMGSRNREKTREKIKIQLEAGTPLIAPESVSFPGP
jgi:hypothetical protein